MFRLVCLYSFVLLIFGQTLVAQERVAFVVGNSVYDHAPPLSNPGNDAHLIARTLRDLDFDVTLHQNLSRWQIAGQLANFLERTEGADLTLVYFAGHGMQFEGRNYILGTDARLRTELDVEAETLALDQVISLLRRNSRAALVFVDACRDNPIADTFYRTNFSATRALASRGLAPARAAFDGAMVTFAASPGQVAYDGEGVNSPFAQALAKHLPSPNIEILTLMKRVARDVRSATEDRQIPTVNNDLTREIVLKKVAAVTPPAAASVSPEPDNEVETVLSLEAMRSRIQDRLPPEEAEAAMSLTNEDRRNAQRILEELGYDPGPIDGVFGNRTRVALARFQLENGLTDTGYMNDRSLVVMLKTLEEAPTSRDGRWRVTLNRRDVGRNGSNQMVAVIGFLEFDISGRNVTIVEERNLSMAPNPAKMDTRASLSRAGQLLISLTVNHIPHENNSRRVSISVDLPERVLVGQRFDLTKRDLGGGFVLEPKLRRKSSSR